MPRAPIHARLRAAAAIAGLLAALIGPATATLAGAPTSESVLEVSLSCDTVTTADGSAGGGMDIGFGDPEASFGIWDVGHDPSLVGPDIVSTGSQLVGSTEASWDFDLQLARIDPETGEQLEDLGAGAGHFEVTSTIASDPIDRTFKQGNRQVREVGLHREVAASATLGGDQIPSFAFATCAGTVDAYVRTSTNPTAHQEHSTLAGLSCDSLTDEAGDLAFVFGNQNDHAQSIEVDVFPAEGGSLSGVADLRLNIGPGPFRWTGIGLVDDTGASTATARLAGTLTQTGTQSSVQVWNGGRVKADDTDFSVAGTLTLSNGMAFDLGSCGAFVEHDEAISNANGAVSPGGPAPANDAPEGALALAGRAKESTAGASPAAEVDASCAPIVYTVWFSVEGTGGPMTIDTAGSTFDTALAVYAGDPGALAELGCGDDYPVGTFFRSLQGQVTFDSQAGVRYLVQAGGFDYAPIGGPAQVGTLRISVSA